MTDPVETPRTNFIRQIVEEDLASGRHQRIATRFPPEPNGYLHIGHAKSIALNFGLAQDYPGTCNLRFDDTNPNKEDVEFVESIKADVRWLGFDWEDRLYFASDYFEQLYDFAIELIGKGLAYVCDLSAEEVREYRGTLTEPGRESPYRNRSVEENLDLFRRMRAGEFPDGARSLRARIDMASPNINLRDPVLYRIRHGVIHHQTGTEWCLYPDLRLHPPDLGCAGVHYPLHLHPGVRGSSAPLRLVRGQRLGPLQAPPDRVQPAQSRIHRDEQAAAHPARLGGPCARLGRPAHADHRRAASARLYALRHSGLLRANRGDQVR